jgi:large subunit ribosomal protein L5
MSLSDQNEEQPAAEAVGAENQVDPQGEGPTEAAPYRQRPARSGRAARGQRGGAAATVEVEAQAEETAPPPPRLREVYRDQIVPSMMREFGFVNPMQVPKVQKIVLNIGVGEALTNARAMESATRDLATISGQKPIITRARKSIAAFKVREGNPIGTTVTLRGSRMYYFLDRLIYMALPRIRDFRGIPRRGFDGRGNFSIGIREQIIFPEIDYNQIDRIRGLQVTIATNARNDAEAMRLLELYGMPFMRQA